MKIKNNLFNDFLGVISFKVFGYFIYFIGVRRNFLKLNNFINI